MPRLPALSVASVNVRVDCEQFGADHPDHWPRRAPVLTDWLTTTQPTLPGLQEPLGHQLDRVAQALPEHRWVGFGREGGSHGELCPIGYDARRITLNGWDQFWLSDTPRLIGSTGWGANFPRIVVVADLTDRASGTRFTMMNTHLDHESETARVRGAESLLGRRVPGRPTIVTGDFNAGAEQSEPWHVLTQGGLTDTWLTARTKVGPGHTFHDYTEDADSGRIDWILTSPELTVAGVEISDGRQGQTWPSDHRFVLADLRLPESQ